MYVYNLFPLARLGPDLGSFCGWSAPRLDLGGVLPPFSYAPKFLRKLSDDTIAVRLDNNLTDLNSLTLVGTASILSVRSMSGCILS